MARGVYAIAEAALSIHAARSINTLDHKGLEQPNTYIARGTLSNNRLSLLPGRQ